MKLFFMLPVVFGLVAAPLAAQKKDHVDFYKQGLEALEQSKLNDAEKAFAGALNLNAKELVDGYGVFNKKPYLPHYQLGVTLARKKSCRAALAQFEKSESFKVVQKTESFADLEKRKRLCEERVAQLDQALAGGRKSVESAGKARDGLEPWLAKRELQSFWEEGSPSRREQAEAAAAKIEEARAQLDEESEARQEEAATAAADLADGAAQALRAFEAEARQKQGELSQAVAAGLGRIDEAEKNAAAVLRAVASLEPFPPKLSAQVELLRSEVAQVATIRASNDGSRLEALIERLSRETRNLRNLAAPPSQALANAAEALLANEPQRVLTALEGETGKDDRERFYSLLLRAAARYQLYLRSGATAAEFLGQAETDLRQAIALPVATEPPARFFSPRFLALYRKVAGGGP